MTVGYFSFPNKRPKKISKSLKYSSLSLRLKKQQHGFLGIFPLTEIPSSESMPPIPKHRPKPYGLRYRCRLDPPAATPERRGRVLRWWGEKKERLVNSFVVACNLLKLLNCCLTLRSSVYWLRYVLVDGSGEFIKFVISFVRVWACINHFYFIFVRKLQEGRCESCCHETTSSRWKDQGPSGDLIS